MCGSPKSLFRNHMSWHLTPLLRLYLNSIDQSCDPCKRQRHRMRALLSIFALASLSLSLACRLSIHRLKAKCRLLTMSEQQTRDCWWTLSFFSALYYILRSADHQFRFLWKFLSLSRFVHSFINCCPFISCAGGRQRRNDRETAQQSSWDCKRQARFYARGIARQTAHITQIGRKKSEEKLKLKMSLDLTSNEYMLSWPGLMSSYCKWSYVRI